MDELTPTMQEAVAFARKFGGQLERFPGGYWCEPGRTQWSMLSGTSFKSSTIDGMVKRGAAEYIEWKDGRNGTFPVRVKVKESRDA